MAGAVLTTMNTCKKIALRMKAHERIETILKMIEAIDPEDRWKLRILDDHVYRFRTGFNRGAETPDTCYSTNRNELKAIRPERYIFNISARAKYRKVIGASACYTNLRKPNVCFVTPILPTEELAELHAIIQAIEYERQNGDIHHPGG